MKKIRRTTKHSKIFYVELFFFIFILLIFALKISNYSHFAALNPLTWASSAHDAYEKTSYKISELRYFGKCDAGYKKIVIGQQYICRAHAPASIYTTIYDTTPRDPNGLEIIYPYFNQWSQSSADDLLRNQYDIDRYKPVTLASLPTWNEDPYHDEYWRFNFYSLRNTKSLLNAATKTRDPKYAKKLVQIMDSFDTVGINQPNAWRDPHAVAWRSMTMVDIWSQLRALNELPISTSTRMLQVMQRQGEYLSKAANYEAQYNHGTNESAALYQLGNAQPLLPGASAWAKLGAKRVNTGLATIIDNDGALIEHSPYYDFYALTKYWDIYTYSAKHKLMISNDYPQKIKTMIHYATYILQPNGGIPIISSSLQSTVHNSAEYAEMADLSPEFKYAITQGQAGSKPTQKDIQFNDTGQTIFRSTWQSKHYNDQTQAIFNYGSYITNHSQLDNLSLNLYGGGTPLLSAPGLYTYDKTDPLHAYFYGTRSQNTVTVDGQDQTQGSGSANKLVTAKGYSSQSASNKLNPHVTHMRQVITLGPQLMLIIDKLHSDDNQQHVYTQSFNLAPGLAYTKSGKTVVGQGKHPGARVALTQLSNVDSTSHVYNSKNPLKPGGICSVQYGKLTPCHQIGATITAHDAQYVTLVQIGEKDKNLSYKLSGNTIYLNHDGKKINVNIASKTGTNIDASVDSTAIPSPAETVIDNFARTADWQTTNATVVSTADSYKPGAGALELNSANGSMSKRTALNLSNKNLLMRMKVPQTSQIKNVTIVLHSGAGTAQLNLLNGYEAMRDSDGTQAAITPSATRGGDWQTISLAKGSLRNQQGQWTIRGSGFTWNAIDKIDFSVESNDKLPQSVYFGQLSATPGQTSGKVSLVFDDGSTSIMPAIDYMNAHKMKGTIAVIGKYTQRRSKGYLSFSQLHAIKDSGWSLVNHSYNHQDAVTQYYDQANLEGFQADLLEGAKFLQDSNLGTDPNWYVYPHGTTNTQIKAIVGKYYKFGRTELTAPEAFPFGSPLAVKDFIVENDVAPSDVIRAIDDANTYHQTLLLTFHRIHALPSDQSGYDFASFKQIIDYLAKTHSTELSLNQLDESNNIPISKLKVTPASAAQLSSTTTIKQPTLIDRLKNIF